jgi:hypothetical protein
VRDLIRENWKIAAVFAGVAFLLSLLVGLLSGNPFGAATFRALLLGVCFAGLGVGLRFVVTKYLPELAGGSQASERAPAGERESRGTKIDIVLPEEAPPVGVPESEAEPVSDAELAEPVAGGDEDAGTDAEAETLSELSSELAGDEPERPASGAEAEREPRGRRGENRGGAAERESEGGLDSLPDISSLEVAAESDNGAREPSARRASPTDALRGAVSGQDPLTIARAIRTVLKRDEKG